MDEGLARNKDHKTEARLAVCIRLRNRQVWDLGGIGNGGRGSVQHRPTDRIHVQTEGEQLSPASERASEMKGEHADEKHVAERGKEGRRGKCRRGCQKEEEERRACAVPVWVEEEEEGSKSNCSFWEGVASASAAPAAVSSIPRRTTFSCSRENLQLEHIGRQHNRTRAE